MKYLNRAKKATRRKKSEEPNRRLAERCKHDAYILAREQGKSGVYSKEPMELYEKAAKYFMKVKDFTDAASCFHDAGWAARHYNERGSGEKISETKRNNLRRNCDRMHKLREGKWKIKKTRRLETLAASFLGIIIGIFFLSSNLTGNVIGNLSNSSSNYIGIVSLVIGLVGVYLWKRK